MIRQSLTFSFLILLLAPADAFGTLTLQAVEVGTIPATDSIFRSVPLGDKLLFSAGNRGSQQLYSYDGMTISAIDNPLGAVDPSIGVNQIGSGPDDGAIFNGEYYYSATTGLGRSVFKTDGNTIDFVADVDPSLQISPIEDFIATDTNVFFKAIGPSGWELFRTDGINTVGLAINAFGPQRFGNEIIFTAPNPDTARAAAFRADGNSASLLTTTVTQYTALLKEVDGSLYWLFEDQLYRYDGTTVETVSEVSNISSLQLAPMASNDQLLTFSGLGSNGWAIFTWDGTSIREFDTDPSGEGTRPYPTNYFDDGFYFRSFGTANGDEMSRITEKSLITYDVAPGQLQSSPDTDTAVLYNKKIVFRATGPNGNEMYIGDESGFRLLADINPSGDAFPLTVARPIEFDGRIYFRAYSPNTGTEIFSTDGINVEILADILPGPESSNYNFGDPLFADLNVGLLLFNVDLLPFQSGYEVYVSDGTSTISLDSIVGNETTGVQDHVGIARYKGDLLYFGKSGQVFRISVVPEPASIAMLILGILVCSTRKSSLHTVNPLSLPLSPSP